MRYGHTPIRLTALVVLLFAALPAFAGNESRSDAYPLSGGIFEVFADFSENSVYWCGAATYAITQLGASGLDRVYVWQGPSEGKSRPGRKSVKFALTQPPGASVTGGLTRSVQAVGMSLSVAQAKLTCDERTASG